MLIRGLILTKIEWSSDNGTNAAAVAQSQFSRRGSEKKDSILNRNVLVVFYEKKRP